MRKNSISTYKIMLGLLFCFPFSFSYGQNAKEVAEIVKSYDLNKIKSLEQQFRSQAKANKKEALEAAKINNWPEFIKNSDGSIDELMRLTPDGQPLYYSINNKAAAASTRTNFLNTGGGLGLNLDGQGMTARVWDAGKVRASHREFGGRVSVIDNTAGPTGNHFHATHVTGTIAAQGVTANAKGMANQAEVRTFDWTSDSAEALAEVQLGMLLSNHSYGVPIVNQNTGATVGTWYIGSYTAESREWDEVTYNSPYYLQVVSAGNDGNTNNPEPTTPGFDKLTGNKVSKNNLVVANANDASINSSTGALLNVTINSSSSEGPSDDFRIKPDITGNGTNVYSTLETSDNAYGNLTGTSMAAPNVTGTLLLLQQYYKNLNNSFMKAATLKALACHTADDAGKAGPDAIFGWGLLNAKKAAEAITSNGLSSIISELTLTQGQTYSTTISSDGISPLEASIVWNDVPGIVNNGILNDPTPKLINDLDIRLTKNGTTYYPWRLQSNSNLLATNTGDNNVDNVERISIPVAAGTYTLTVSHKGTLQQGPQNFSLVVTGITSSFALSPLTNNQTICSTESASYSFKYATANSENTLFSAVDLPNGAIANFSSPSMSENGEITMTLSNWQNVAPGEYTIGIKGENTHDTKIEYVKIRIYSNSFQNVTLLTPLNNANTQPTNVRLAWTPETNAEAYRVQISNESTFSNLITNVIVSDTNYTITDLEQETNYFWRVLPINSCGEAINSDTFNFSTGIVTCGNVFSATDFSTSTITTLVNAEATVPLTITGGMRIGNLSISVNLPHTALGELTVYLEGPEAIGSPRIILLKESCEENGFIIADFNDAGANLVCSSDIPSVGGMVKPFEPLASLNGLSADGTWKLTARDNKAGNGGRINDFTLSFCNVQPSLSIETNKLKNISVYPNPTKGILNIELKGANTNTTILNLYDIQGRKVLSKETQSSEESLNIENLSNGIYMLSIESGSLKITKKVVLNR